MERKGKIRIGVLMLTLGGVSASAVVLASREVLLPFSATGAVTSPRSATISFNGEGLEVSNALTNGVKIASSGVSQGSKGNNFAIASDGYVGNTTPINNVTAITVTGKEGGTIKIDVGYEKGIFASFAEGSFDGSETYSFDSYTPMPRFFKVSATEGLELNSISFSYGCGIGADITANPGFASSYFNIADGYITGTVNKNESPVLGVISSDDVSGIKTAIGSSNFSQTKVLSMKGSLDVFNNLSYVFSPTAVETLDLREYAASVNSGMFPNMGSLKRVLIGKDMMEARGDWFSGCSLLREIFLPEGETTHNIANGTYIRGNTENIKFYKFTDNRSASGDYYWGYNDLGEPYVISTGA